MKSIFLESSMHITAFLLQLIRFFLLLSIGVTKKTHSLAMPVFYFISIDVVNQTDFLGKNSFLILNFISHYGENIYITSISKKYFLKWNIHFGTNQNIGQLIKEKKNYLYSIFFRTHIIELDTMSLLIDIMRKSF
jgi:hypothetical protein